MKLPPSSLRVEDCLALNLNLHEPLPWPLSSLLLANISSLAITLGSNSNGAKGDELILLDSTITSNFHFTNKESFSKLIVEGCTFKKAFNVYSKLPGEETVPDLVSVTGSEFQGEVEMMMKGGRNPRDTFILLHDNW